MQQSLFQHHKNGMLQPLCHFDLSHTHTLSVLMITFIFHASIAIIIPPKNESYT